MYLVDTNILIDFLRGRPPGKWWRLGLQDVPSVSVITVAEFYTGLRGCDKEQRLMAMLISLRLLPVTPTIAEAGGRLANRFRHSHGVTLPDALIAATAVEARLRLAPLKLRHFHMLVDPVAPY